MPFFVCPTKYFCLKSGGGGDGDGDGSVGGVDGRNLFGFQWEFKR